VSLHRKAVHRYAASLENLNQLVVGITLGVDSLHAVVVEEQLRVGVRSVGPPERLSDDAAPELPDPDVVLGA
jgi:hypothetical protein